MRAFSMLAGLIAACAVMPVWAQNAPPPSPPAAASPASSPLPAAAAPVPVPFDQALVKAANDLLSKANIPPAGNGPVLLTIDPLIDGVTGQQSRATRSMERRIVEMVGKDYPRYKVLPFTSNSVEQSPIVLIGTFTAINNDGKADGTKDAYRICLALADLKTNKIISKGVARAKPDGIDATPTASFAEAPIWVKDPETDAYIKSCQGTKPGDPIDQFYADRIVSAALISDGIEAYNDGRYQQAIDLYKTALDAKGGDQLRAFNGLYLAHWKLRHREETADAFGKLVDYSLDHNKLAVMFLFKPASLDLWSANKAKSPYTMWLQQIAARAEQRKACLEVTGHTTRTGLPGINDRLSVLRAEFIKYQIAHAAPDMLQRTLATGVGSRDNLIGTALDNASDALDRRVEFKVIPCG